MNAVIGSDMPIWLATLRTPAPFQAIKAFCHSDLIRPSSLIARHSIVDNAAPLVQTTVMDAADTRDIQLSKGGDGPAFERLIRRYQQAIARRMSRFSNNPRQLEELTHDVFVEAFLSLRSYRGEAPFQHWLMGIATRVGFKFWKQQGRDRKRESLTEQIEVSVPAPQADQYDDTLTPVLNQLSPRDRIVITLLYLEEKSVAEAAKALGWSQTMVKVQAFRARGKLRKLMTGSVP